MPQPTPRLHADGFEELIDRRGRQVQWQEATTCSCISLDSGQPLYTCQACHGKGFVYEAPKIATVAVTGLTLSNNWEQMAGMFEVGDAIMTVPKNVPKRNANGIPIVGQSTPNPIFEIGMNDKITLLDDEFKSSEVLIKNEPIGSREADTLLNEQITRVKTIKTFDSDTGIVTNYLPGIDYTLDKNRVVWLPNGQAPEDYQKYSVTYFHKPSYVVIATLPKPRHQDGQDLPRYVALRYLSGAVNRA